ncbi:MAG: FGGY-family carbohydrate kinase [Gemmobacter sp.]|nr:FGGY-family carbohydrate kinase [Gemmobacter sp.]
MRTVLTCDLGGTSLRVALFDGTGTMLARADLPGQTTVDDRGASDADAGRWWADFAAGVEAVAQGHPTAFAKVAGIAVSGVTRTQILIGADGTALRPALTWKDTRASQLMPALTAHMPPDHPDLGNLNAYHPIARLFWLAQHEPEVIAATRAVLEPKDWFAFRLTGVAAVDPIGSARLLAGLGSGASGRDMFAAAGLSAAMVPPALPPARIIAPVQPGLPGALAHLAGVPVVSMGHDTWASVLGLGALRAGMAYNLSGTTEVFGVLSDTPAQAQGLMAVDWAVTHQLGGPSLCGGDTVVWALDLLAKGMLTGALSDLLAGPRQPEPVIFLPYLQGERTPWWNPALRGAFVGLNRRHGATDLAYGVLEGIAFLNRTVLQRAETATGQPIRDIRFGGGGASNPDWCRIKADVCNRPVSVTDCAEPGLLGAAIAAFHALGDLPSLTEGQDRFVRIARRHDPDPVHAAAYDRLYALFQASEQALAPISEQMSDFRMP